MMRLRVCASSRQRGAPFFRRLSTEAKKDEWQWAPYVVFGILGSLGAWFWRASTSQSNRVKVLEAAEKVQALDDKEKEGLREANDALTAEVFGDLARGCARRFGGLERKASYPSFVECATAYLERPLQKGHLLDRVVVSKVVPGGDEDFEVGFLVAALGLAASGSADERARAYASILGADDATPVHRRDLERLIAWLDQAGHIPPDVMVTETEPKYPAQHYALKPPATVVDDLAKEVVVGAGDDVDDDHWSHDQVVQALTSSTLKIP